MPAERALISHLFRRAGFGATSSELDLYASREYEEIVEDLLHPELFPEIEEDVIRRYHLEINNPDSFAIWQSYWLYRMVNSKQPLKEKIALFWHHVFATSTGKSEHTPSAVSQIDTFRNNGLGDLRTIYLDLARDPAS